METVRQLDTLDQKLEASFLEFYESNPSAIDVIKFACRPGNMYLVLFQHKKFSDALQRAGEKFRNSPDNVKAEHQLLVNEVVDQIKKLEEKTKDRVEKVLSATEKLEQFEKDHSIDRSDYQI